jgi:ATP-dependent Lon protease
MDLNDAKMQIMQMIGQWISNPKAVGTAIAIKGPMGTGKTTLVKEGISKILNRDFAFLALGGATDSSFLEGHGYTYEGSTWGKIVDILIKSKSMNPVIYFDELDKISETPKGEEIAGILNTS